ncbi:MAG: hypothetical protein OXC31_15255 [Spirochaetaceae bacterium]|nr:hypothetical protein [Spirochaetaceae bacterium]
MSESKSIDKIGADLKRLGEHIVHMAHNSRLAWEIQPMEDNWFRIARYQDVRLPTYDELDNAIKQLRKRDR